MPDPFFAFQLAASSLPAMNGPRRLHTFWAAAWRNCPQLFSSISTRVAPCSAPPPSAKALRRAAWEMVQVPSPPLLVDVIRRPHVGLVTNLEVGGTAGVNR